MKVLKISNALLKQLEEIDFFLKKIEKNALIKKIKPIRKYIFEIRKLHDESSPVELSILDDLLLELNDILRYFIVHKLNFRDYAFILNKFSRLIDKSMKNAYYDFFRLCGECAKCCVSPHVFSFEHNFIDKHHKYLKRKGLSYVIKNNPKTGLCALYNAKTKKCSVYHERPLDCTFFPFSFVIKKISDPRRGSKNYIFLTKATECDVADRLSLNDALEALEIVCFILSKIPLKEAIQYSDEADPRRMLFSISIPYDERKIYYKALKQIFATKSYMRRT